ncbi:ATP-binding protein [Mucilaginibacter sp.]|uniref:ATP-binding protein n=1 Tax=Mucilaginibacter sp. TaxID=1882438 RepID=UPI0035BBA46A
MLDRYALQTMVDTLPVAACVFTGTDQVITAINEPMLKAWAKIEDILDQSVDVVLNDIGFAYGDELANIHNSGKQKHFTEVCFLNQEVQEPVYFKISFKPLKDRSGVIYGVMHTAVDITTEVSQRLQVDTLNQDLSSITEELEASNEELRTVNEELQSVLDQYRSGNEKLHLAKSAAGIGIFDWDLLSGQVNWDARAREIFAVPDDQRLLGPEDLINRLYPDDRSKVKKALAYSRDRVLSAGQYDTEYRLDQTAEGALVWVSAKGQVFFDIHDNPIRFVGIVMDISQSKKHQAELQQLNEELAAMNEELNVSLEEIRSTNEYLQESKDRESELRVVAEKGEARNQLVLDTIAEGLGLFDQNGKTYYLNAKGHELLELEQGTVTGRTYNDHRWINLRADGSVMPPEEHPMFVALKTKKALAGQEVTLKMPDDRLVIMLINAAPLFDHNEKLTGGVATFMDITQLRENQNRLRESEALLQEANEELTAINEEQQAVNGELRQAQEKLLASNAKLLTSEEDLRLTLEAANLGTFSLDILSGNVQLNERCFAMFGLDPNEEPDREMISNIIAPEYVNIVQNAMDSSVVDGELCDVQYEIILRQTDERIWYRSVGKTFRSESGEAIRFYGVVVDINIEKQMERRKDDFITIASHELKTPVTSLKAALQLIDKLKDNPSHPMIPKLIFQSRRSVERVSTLIDDLLNIGRLQQDKITLNKTDFILSELINACANPVSITAKKSIRITGELELVVHADEHQIDQVITNYLTNAVKYATESKQIDVSLETAGNYVKVSVTDQGPGIPSEKLEHLFDRYYRVNDSGISTSGLGLGLYICAEIIQRHGGEIGAASELGNGSTFWFTLPL